MRFFPAFASANKVILPVLFLAGASGARAGDDFRLDRSTVTAGRTLAVICPTGNDLERVAVLWRGRRIPFFHTHGHEWRARIGVPPLEPAGTKNLLIEGAWARGGPFLAELAFDVVGGTYPVSRVLMAPERDALYTSGAVDRDAAVLAMIYTQAPSLKKLWTGPFQRPAPGVVSSPFGARRAYGDRPAQSPHTGMDIAAPLDTPVTAPQRGRVLYAGWMDSFGFVVLLDHGQGVYSYYLHMRRLEARAGDLLKTGDPVGLVGQEGVATGPHVHWSFVVSGERVDPQEWVERGVP